MRIEYYILFLTFFLLFVLTGFKLAYTKFSATFRRVVGAVERGRPLDSIAGGQSRARAKRFFAKFSTRWNGRSTIWLADGNVDGTEERHYVTRGAV